MTAPAHVNVVGGRAFKYAPGAGWTEIVDEPPAEDVEALMVGRTPEEAQSARRALRRRAARQGRQLRDSTEPAVVQDEALAVAQGRSSRHPWLTTPDSPPVHEPPLRPSRRLELPRRGGGTFIPGGVTAT